MTRDRRFLLCALSFIFGIFLFPFAAADLWILFLVAALAMVAAFTFDNEKAKTLSLIVLFVVAGLLRFSFCEKMSDVENELQKINSKKISLECEIVEIPQVKNGKQQVTLSVNNKNFPHGKILAFMSAYGDYSYGDKVKFEGSLKIPESFDEFDYRKYLFQKNIFFVSYYPKIYKVAGNGGGFYGAIYDFRKRADGKITGIMPAPQGNILSAMTLGANSDEIKGVMDNFNKTGTSHIIVVSGSHLGIIMIILSWIFLGAGINRNKVFYLVIIGIAVFIILSGSAAAAVRSGIMAFVFLLAVKIGRAKNAANALIFSAALMIFINPYILAGDIGFQLSFLATFGLVFVLPFFQEKFKNWPEYGGMKNIFLTTLSAQAATFPVIITNFGQFSFLSFIANILILPTVPAVMVGGFLLVVSSFLNVTLAQILAWPIYFVLSYYLTVVNFLSNTNFGLIKF